MDNKLYIIINADDLGAGLEINDTIFKLISSNTLTSSTILANAPAFENAVIRIPDYPNCSFGAHLNVTQFKPLTSNVALRSILDSKGDFNGNLFHYKVDSVLKQAIFEEWSAQIRKIQSYGIKLSHIDSHQHVHTLPQLFMVLKSIQRKFGIRKVRISRNIYSSTMPIVSKGLRYKKMLWNLCLRKYYITKTTSGFTSFSTFLEVVKDMEFKCKIIEIMVHPGSVGHKEETDALQTSWINELPFAVQLINYDAI